MVRYWNTILNLDHSRLPKRLFLWDYYCVGNTWSKEISKVFISINQEHVYKSMVCCDLKQVESRLLDIYVARWQLSIEKMPKLRTYIKVKDIYEPEIYIIKSMSRRRHSLMSKLRTGILPLEIEVGRYLPIYDKTSKRNRKRESHERICKLCD